LENGMFQFQMNRPSSINHNAENGVVSIDWIEKILINEKQIRTIGFTIQL